MDQLIDSNLNHLVELVLARRRWSAMPLYIAVAALFSTNAGAATISNVESIVRYAASPGERNLVTVQLVDPVRDGESFVWTIRDEGAMLSLSGCVALDEHTGRCDAGGSIELELGDMNDSLEIVELHNAHGRGGHADVDAGPGDDAVATDVTSMTAGGSATVGLGKPRHAGARGCGSGVAASSRLTLLAA